MLAMFIGFSAYFFYDWKVGYPAKREIYDTYLTYEAEWEQLTEEGKTEEVEAKRREWVQEAQEKEWELDLKTFEPESKIDDAKIAEQLYFAIGTAVLSGVILIYFLVNLRKTLQVDGESVKLPNGKRVPYSSISKVDTRRWGNKGLASIYFEDNGKKQSAKIDGLKFGGFIKPEPYIADLILERITTRFEGDLVELEEIEEDDESSDAPEVKPDDEPQEENKA